MIELEFGWRMKKMIKIIKEGTKKIQECPHCGCLFSYEKDDIIYEKENTLYESHRNRFLSDEIMTRSLVKCPQCGEEILLMANKLRCK